jgi:hypothetical protein
MWLLLFLWIVSVTGRNLVGEFREQRDSLGNLLPKQCHGSTGYCWCLDESGVRFDISGPGIPLDCPPLLLHPPRSTV